MKLKLGIGLGISYRLKKKKFSDKYKKKTKKTLIYLTVSFTVDLLSLTVARSFLLPLSLPFALWSHAQRVGTGTKGQKQRAKARDGLKIIKTNLCLKHKSQGVKFTDGSVVDLQSLIF